MLNDLPKIIRTLQKSKDRKGRLDPLRLSAQGDQIVVWLEFHGRRRERVGAVNRELAADASRYGQDLVDELVETALQMADRRAGLRSYRA